MLPRPVAIVLLIFAAAAICGCTGPTQLDQNWGRSYETAKASQILHPGTGKDTKPVEGLDGESVMGILERYKQDDRDKSKPSSGLGVLSPKK